MGTSADREGGSGGAWSPYKRAATDYAKSVSRRNGGDRIKVERVLGRHVHVLGGSASATTSASTGRRGLANLAGLLAGIAGQGLAQTLDSFGLRGLIGKDRFDVLDGLVTAVAGDGSDVESQAARDALCDVLEELYDDADAWDELTNTQVTEEGLVDLLEMYLAHYIYNRLPVLAERLARIMDPAAAQAADAQIVQTVRSYVNLNMPDDSLNFDWRGDAGEIFATEAIRAVYEILDGLE